MYIGLFIITYGASNFLRLRNHATKLHIYLRREEDRWPGYVLSSVVLMHDKYVVEMVFCVHKCQFEGPRV